MARDPPEARAAKLMYRKQVQVDRVTRRAEATARTAEERVETRRVRRSPTRPTVDRPAGDWVAGNGTFSLEVVGKSYSQQALDRVCGGRTGESQDRVVTAVLVLDDDNP